MAKRWHAGYRRLSVVCEPVEKPQRSIPLPSHSPTIQHGQLACVVRTMHDNAVQRMTTQADAMNRKIDVRVTDAILEALQSRSEETGAPVAELVRRAIAAYLELPLSTSNKVASRQAQQVKDKPLKPSQAPSKAKRWVDAKCMHPTLACKIDGIPHCGPCKEANG